MWENTSTPPPLLGALPGHRERRPARYAEVLWGLLPSAGNRAGPSPGPRRRAEGGGKTSAWELLQFHVSAPEAQEVGHQTSNFSSKGTSLLQGRPGWAKGPGPPRGCWELFCPRQWVRWAAGGGGPCIPQHPCLASLRWPSLSFFWLGYSFPKLLILHTPPPQKDKLGSWFSLTTSLCFTPSPEVHAWVHTRTRPTEPWTCDPKPGSPGTSPAPVSPQ